MPFSMTLNGAFLKTLSKRMKTVKTELSEKANITTTISSLQVAISSQQHFSVAAFATKIPFSNLSAKRGHGLINREIPLLIGQKREYR